MPKYNYSVVNAENKQLTGTINAADDNEAKKQLNALGFSVINISLAPEGAAPQLPTAEGEEEVLKFEFGGIDKNGKKVAGTIQGLDLYLVYKRLTDEYQFQVFSLYPADLSVEEKQKAIQKGVAELADRYQEETFTKSALQKQQELSQQEFEQKQDALKHQIDFVLNKVNEMIDTYKEELDPQTKNKIKYYVEKILRIKNSTNLEYIRHTAEEMLDYIQKAELFLNQEQRLKEKTQMAIEAKSMMLELHDVNAKGQKDMAESMREWRQTHIVENNNPTPVELIINTFFSIFIGGQPDTPEIIEARQQLLRTKRQLKEFFFIYLQSPNKEFKRETLANLKRLWNLRKEQKKKLRKLIQEKKKKYLESTSATGGEIFLREIFKLAGWVFFFYMIYYYLAIYSSSKTLNLPVNFGNIFQTSIIKYFFIVLFLFVAFLGIKLEFFLRKKKADPALAFLFLIFSLVIVLNS